MPLRLKNICNLRPVLIHTVAVFGMGIYPNPPLKEFKVLASVIRQKFEEPSGFFVRAEV